MSGRALQSGRSTCATQGAGLLLALYLAWLLSPVLHELHLGLHGQEGDCRACPAAEPDWQIVSHPPGEPCSDPDHRPGPAHDEDHCPTCRLGALAIAELPLLGDPVQPVRLTHIVGDWGVLAPHTPALLTASPRAPPPPAIA